jgi:nucleoid DNA-binding protein
MTKQHIAELISNRDDIEFDDAMNMVNECQDMINEAINEGSVTEIDQILMEYLGLEPDFIWAFI